MDLQTLFAIIYGIYFATTVATVGKFYPFDTTAAAAGDGRALARLLVSFLFLNLHPFGYFMLVLSLIEGRTEPITGNLWSALGVFLASLGGFAIYRFYIAIITWHRSDRAKYVFYSDPGDFPANQRLRDHAKERQLPAEATILPGWAIAAGGVAWFLLSFGLFWILTLCLGRHGAV